MKIKLLLLIILFTNTASAATFNLGSLTMPDANVTPNLDRLKRVIPINAGEANLAYLKRCVKQLLIDTVKEGEKIINNETKQNTDTGIDL